MFERSTTSTGPGSLDIRSSAVDSRTGGGSMERTLFDRLGGMDAITAVVQAFRDRVAKDDRINLKFARTDLARLTKMLLDQVCEATGGPCQYRRRCLKEADAGRAVSA